MKTTTQCVTKKLKLLLIILPFIVASNIHSMRLFSSLLNNNKKIKKNVKTAELRDGTFVNAEYVQIVDAIFKEEYEDWKSAYAVLFNQIRKKCTKQVYEMDPQAEIVSREFKLHPTENEDACAIIKNLFFHIKVNETRAAIINYPFKRNRNNTILLKRAHVL